MALYWRMLGTDELLEATMIQSARPIIIEDVQTKGADVIVVYREVIPAPQPEARRYGW